MSIQYFEEEKLFQIDTENTTYVIGLLCNENYVGHLYYGRKLKNLDGIKDIYRTEEYPFVPDHNNRDRLGFYDSFLREYAGHGIGDYRESALMVTLEDGSCVNNLSYVSHVICKGKKGLEGMPATFGKEEETQTLILTCKDVHTGLRVDLKYSVFAGVDAIIRSVDISNESKQNMTIEKAMSGMLDMELHTTSEHYYEAISLHGSWARERHITRRKLERGMLTINSLKGETSHQDQPFLAVVSNDCNEQKGDAYGFHFIYSGNFSLHAQVNQFDSLRVSLGINPEYFSWALAPGEHFETPEMVMVYSAAGLGQMTRSFHKLYREHLIRSPYLHLKRPILINNWEATYFDFNTDKLLAIAQDAAAAGIEMLVLDDGWFSGRKDDNSSLGDWQENLEKLPGGLKTLAEKVNALGMHFGLWFEPEMISPDSDLYRAHPDWAIAVPGRVAGLARNQYVLDISRKEVRDAILEQVFKVLHSANISYVKWDMNRPLADLYSTALPKERQGELSHKYVLGLYEMQERLLQEFPNLLLENCSGGGGRFDPAMLYYSPQIWCSDDTDAIERLMIQEGTALIYPLSAMGAHVSVCPNHIVGRITPFKTRGNVALAGTFGYELDITKLSKEDKLCISRQIEIYHLFNDLIREGDYYRIASYAANHLYDCYQVSSADKTKSLVFYTQVLSEPNQRGRGVLLDGLLEDATYRLYEVDSESGEVMKDTGLLYNGGVLMHSGYFFRRMFGDYQSRLLYLEMI